jgi:energy-coupling factor transporter ATP-binding protein EcfA2
MKFFIDELHVAFKKSKETIKFSDFTYFYGPMGAGKSTIARLVDFCLGGSLGDKEMTPALQSEFVSASLLLKIEDTVLNLRRDCGANLIRANWKQAEELVEVMIPARSADGEVIAESGIEVLSDLIYVLGGKTPPKVRKSKIKEDSELARLSIRDLLWYCYLDQDSMDSSFFHLEGEAEFSKRLKSRDVLRFLVGFHQEQVSELEMKLELQRAERVKCEAGAQAIKEALSEAEIASENELADIRHALEQKLSEVEKNIVSIRQEMSSTKPHAMEGIQAEARHLSNEFSAIEQSTRELRDVIGKDRSHRNELLALSTRFRRSQSAREVLGGVNFEDCPQCGRDLPQRLKDDCPVCGQKHTDSPTGNLDEASAEKDLDARVAELDDLIKRHEATLRRNERILRELQTQKSLVNSELNRVARDYDSAYLSTALEAEKQRAAILQQLSDLSRIEMLVQRIVELNKRVDRLILEERKTRSELKEARERAETDTQNLSRLKTLFLNCLLRSKLSGFYTDDSVEMKSPHFLPEVTSAGSGDLAVTSFSNLGSGGKKTLFKCCFAVAIHRLASEIGALLPTLLIIDSPMKNTSERQNREQFEGFMKMLYELSCTELKDTQFVLLDKEFFAPPSEYARSFSSRKMQPNERGMNPNGNPYPPLIPYHQDK